jgi:hypothetical protein
MAPLIGAFVTRRPNIHRSRDPLEKSTSDIHFSFAAINHTDQLSLSKLLHEDTYVCTTVERPTILQSLLKNIGSFQPDSRGLASSS